MAGGEKAEKTGKLATGSKGQRRERRGHRQRESEQQGRDNDDPLKEDVLFIGTQFSNLYTAVDTI